MPAAKSDETETETKVRTKEIIRLTFEDGSTFDSDPGRLSSAIAFERQMGRAFNPEYMSHTLRMTYIQMGSPGGVSDEAFEAWADTIEDMEGVTLEVPTKAPQKG